MESALAPILCKFCSSLLTEEHGNSPQGCPLCKQVLCNSCVLLSLHERRRCVKCDKSLDQVRCFSKDNTSGTRLQQVCFKANLELRQVLKSSLKIGFWPKGLPAEFNQQWLPSFDAALFIFTNQIRRWEVQKDKNTTDFHLLRIELQEPYLFTKFLFNMMGKVVRHDRVTYVLCSPSDKHLYASEWFRRQLQSQEFDLVCVPHGRTLEPLCFYVQGIQTLQPEFVKKCNLNRAQLTEMDATFSEQHGLAVFTFRSHKSLKQFDAYIAEFGIQDLPDSTEMTCHTVKRVRRCKHAYYQHLYKVVEAEAPPLQPAMLQQPVQAVPFQNEGTSEISSVREKFFNEQQRQQRNNTQKLANTYGRGKRIEPVEETLPKFTYTGVKEAATHKLSDKNAETSFQSFNSREIYPNPAAAMQDSEEDAEMVEEIVQLNELVGDQKKSSGSSPLMPSDYYDKSPSSQHEESGSLKTSSYYRQQPPTQETLQRQFGRGSRAKPPEPPVFMRQERSRSREQQNYSSQVINNPDSSSASLKTSSHYRKSMNVMDEESKSQPRQVTDNFEMPRARTEADHNERGGVDTSFDKQELMKKFGRGSGRGSNQRRGR